MYFDMFCVVLVSVSVFIEEQESTFIITKVLQDLIFSLKLQLWVIFKIYDRILAGA